MGFKENLKSELAYQGMPVKQLSELSGVNKRTIDSYLRFNGKTPSVENAVKIARALCVSVEYLVTGTGNPESKQENLEKNNSKHSKYSDILADLELLSDQTLPLMRAIIKAAAHFKAK